jgi:hypothetical protein
MKEILSLMFVLFFLSSCSELDNQTEIKVDKILASESFSLYTFQASCMYNNGLTLRKDNQTNISFFTSDSSLIETQKYTNSKNRKLKELFKKGYNNNEPSDTGPGNMNRYYRLYSSTDTVTFLNNVQDIFEIFLAVNGVKHNTLDSLEAKYFEEH